MTIMSDEITITPLSADDYAALFDFERRNWDYFAQSVGARPDTYKAYESFCSVQDEIMQAQTDGAIAFYLLYYKSRVIGRVNLRDIKQGSASLGYRICESAIGQGMATEAVECIIPIAKDMGLKRLNAVVATFNIASEKVLLKNGFDYSHTEVKAVSLNNKMIDLKHFYKMLT